MNKVFLMIAIVAFAVRLGYAAATGALRNPQVFEQESIATNLLERHVFLFDSPSGQRYLSYSEPLYPFLAAAVYGVTRHSRTALVLLQLVISAATVWITASATRAVSGNDAAAIAAGLLMVVHPGFIHYSSILHPFILDSFFFIAAAAAIVRYQQDPVLRRGLLAAALIGVGALTRPTILMFLGPLCLIAWRSRESLRQGVKHSLVMVLMALAIVAPWTLRNAVVHRTFMLTRSGTGFVFWLGNNPHSSGSALDRDGTRIVMKAPPEFRTRIANADELTRDRIFYDAAWEYIRERPLAAIGRVLQRIYYFWWFSPQWGAAFSPATRLAYRAWWTALLVLIATGIFVSRFLPQRRDLWLMAGLAVLISIVQSLYYVEGRHRLAVEPLVLPLAAVAIAASSLNPRSKAATATSSSFFN